MRFAAFVFAGWLAADLVLLAQSDGSGPEISVPKNPPPDTAHALPKPDWIDQSQADAGKKSRGCLECHAGVEPMHASKNVVLGCTDCHGGNPTPGLKQTQAHVAPRNPVFWESSANPNDSSVLLNHESAEFIRFVNPGDLRVAETTCGPCHGDIVRDVSHSMMRHGAMLWGAALYNNGAFPEKNYQFRPGLRFGRRAVAPGQSGAGHAGDDAATWHSAIPRSVAAFRHQPAGKYSSNLRARRRGAVATWQS